MEYSALTPAQRTQAETDLFFADRWLGLNPADYDYEVDRAGRVTGRRRAVEQVRRQQIRNQPVILLELVRPETSAEIRAGQEMVINRLAQAVALAVAAKVNAECQVIMEER